MHSSSSRIFPDREERRGGRGTSSRGGASVTILTWASALDPEARYLIILHHGDNPYKGCPLLLYTSSRRKILLLINIGAARDTREVTRGIVASGWWKVLFESSPSLSQERERKARRRKRKARMVQRMERRMTLNLVPPTRGRRICEPVFLLSWVLITAKVIRASLVQVKEAWENGAVEGKRERRGERIERRIYTRVPHRHAVTTNGRSVTSNTLKTHFNHDRWKDRRDRDPSIARPGRVYVLVGVVTLC